MSTAADRVLEQALERVLEDPQVSEERARAVLRALAGQRAAPTAPGSPARRNGVPYRAPERAARPLARSRRALYAGLAAAAALVLVLLLPWWRGGAPPAAPGPVVARAAAPALVLSDAGERRATDVCAGERVRTDAEGAQLALAGGGSLDLAPHSLLAFGAERPALVLGELSVAGPCDVDLGFARLSAPAGARAEALLELAPGAEAAAGAHPGEWYAAQSKAPPRLLRLALSAGAAALECGSARDELAPGDVRVWREDKPPLGPLSKEEAGAVLARLDELWAKRWDASRGAPYETALTDLFAFLDAEPARWDVVGDLARKEFADPKLPPQAKRAWLDLLCLGASPRATELARELWLLGPEVFDPWHVVALAQRGAFEFEREVRARVADPGPDLENAFLPAAWLAERGDAMAQGLLHRLEQRPAETKPELERAWLAAFTLSRSGDPLPLERRLRRLDADVNEALDQRAVGRAADLVLLAEFYLAEGEEPGDVESRLWRAGQYAQGRAAEVQSPGEILRALAQLPR